jgi:hypothetical protein
LDLGAQLGHLPLLVAVGWVVRAPLLSREEGHEAITREAWEGLPLTAQQQRALIRGVRAPDISVAGLLTSTLPFAQPRHALRAWSGTPTSSAIRETRKFLSSRHRRAFDMPEGARRWAAIGEILHCLQDSYSPAHTDRAGAQILRMKHWSPLDRLRRDRSADEHGFPSDQRDAARKDGALTDGAQAAVAASRRYLEIVTRGAEMLEFAELMDECIPIAAEET